MKIATSFLAALLFAGTLGAFNNAIAQDGIISKDEVTDGYCHMTFPEIRQSTLGNDQPVLQDSSTGLVDFYGTCDEKPLGQDQIQAQKLEQQHRFNNNHSPD